MERTRAPELQFLPRSLPSLGAPDESGFTAEVKVQQQGGQISRRILQSEDCSIVSSSEYRVSRMMAADAPDYLFLGEPEWETLPSGRIRCVQTGHEMPVEARATYSQTKKCRSALFDAALKKRAAPLNFFEQSPENKDKIVCKLTGVVLNKKEDAVWKHMMGKKFEQKLAEKELEKERARGDVEMTENSSQKQSSKKKGKTSPDVEMMGDSCRKQKAGKKKTAKSGKRVNNVELEFASKSVQDEDSEGEDSEEVASSEGSDFWIPPAGDRWDFDDGSDDRWTQPGGPETKAEIGEGEVDDDTEMTDGPGVDCVENIGSDEEVIKIRTKRTASGSGKRNKRSKAKRAKGEASN